MSHAERNTWVQVLAGLVGMLVYVWIVLPEVLSRPVGEVDWVGPMLWTIVAAIVVSIAASIGWGVVAGLRDPDEDHRSDQRDREIERLGDRVGQAFLVIGGLGGLVLAGLQAHWFWIGHALFAGFFLAATVGGIARIVVYLRGLV